MPRNIFDILFLCKRKYIKPVIRQVFFGCEKSRTCEEGGGGNERPKPNEQTADFEADFCILVLMSGSIRRLNKNVPAYMGVLSSASPSN